MPKPRFIQINDLTFLVRSAGNPDDPLVMFLHGFPETSIMWSNLMEEAAAKGFYCLAPDMRGYTAGACPGSVKSYTIDKLQQDVIDIASAVKREKFHLVAHDWGAAIGWSVVNNNPKRIISYSALSVPHNSAFGKAYRIDKEQKKKSRYIGFFLLPFIPEWVLRSGDFSKFRKLWKRSSPEELEEYLTVFRRKGTIRGALNYYRANIGKGKGERIGKIKTPTLFIWGNRDLAISRAAAVENAPYMIGEYTFLEVDGGHWLIQSNYQEVREAILKHLLRHQDTGNQ